MHYSTLTTAPAPPPPPPAAAGYNVAVVTFGQTGSGKTYTLVGPDATFAMSEAEFGVLPRAVRHVFAALKVREKLHHVVAAVVTASAY